MLNCFEYDSKVSFLKFFTSLFLIKLIVHPPNPPPIILAPRIYGLSIVWSTRKSSSSQLTLYRFFKPSCDRYSKSPIFFKFLALMAFTVSLTLLFLTLLCLLFCNLHLKSFLSIYSGHFL